MELTKHHGLGNDFLIAIEPQRSLDLTDAIAWCDRRRGMGADGLAEVRQLSSESGDTPALWAMAHWNGDGSIAAVCGNGLRCVGQALAMREGRTEACSYLIRTPGGIRRLDVEPDRRSSNHRVRVDMGPAVADVQLSARFEDMNLPVSNQLGVSIGNPHVVAVTEFPESYDMAEVGPIVEADYPAGVNVHLVRVDSPTSVTMRIWERGAGVTEACGSGACAVAFATHGWGMTEDTVTVNMPGGPVTIEVADTVFMTGPATFVGTVMLND